MKQDNDKHPQQNAMIQALADAAATADSDSAAAMLTSYPQEDQPENHVWTYLHSSITFIV